MSGLELLLAPAVVGGLASLGGSIVSGVSDYFGAQADREERAQQYEKERQTAKEMMEREAELASKERKETFGMEKERSKEMLDAELKYVSQLADKNVDLFNKYYDNLAEKRRQLLAQGLTKEEISDFFDTLLASRGQFAKQASRVPETYYGSQAYGSLSDVRQARIGSLPMAMTPFNQQGYLRRLESGQLGSSFKEFAMALAKQRQKQQKKGKGKDLKAEDFEPLGRSVSTQTGKEKSKSRSRSRGGEFVEIPYSPAEVTPMRGRTMETRATQAEPISTQTKTGGRRGLPYADLSAYGKLEGEMVPSELKRWNVKDLKRYGEERYGILFTKKDKQDDIVNKIIAQSKKK